MPDHTLHAIDGAASNVLGSGFSWGSTGSLTYDEANTPIDTLVFTDNDANLTITDTSLEFFKSKMVSCKTVILGSMDPAQSLAQTVQVLRFGGCLSRSILWKATCFSRKTIADGVT
ncbi:hypothetical protein OAH73_03950 [Planktomarina sp.]|nr:hypothetical protein [Planktomarina sp.]MDB4841713.1 hypothetical protein [Planktomarina sp.]